MKSNIFSKFKSSKNIIEDFKISDICSENQNDKFQTSKKIIKKENREKKPNPKEYLKNLNKNLVNRPGLNKLYQSNSKIKKN